MTNPPEHNPLLAYLQAWRQLLEASAAITAGWPFAPGASSMPPMPPGMPAGSMPPMPPGMGVGFGAPATTPPTDYAQQLFGYVQAWRHYLEQAVSNASGSIQPLQPTAAHPTSPQAADSQAMAPPSATGQPTGSGSDSGSTGSHSEGSSGSASSGSSSFAPKNETRVVLRPRDPFGTITDLNSFSGQELFARPDVVGPAGPEMRPVASGSAFAAKMTPRVAPSATPSAGQSLFSGRRASEPTPAVSQANQDPRRGAPPATSRWWANEAGRRPGFSAAQPAAKNLLSLRPTDLGGRDQ